MMISTVQMSWQKQIVFSMGVLWVHVIDGNAMQSQLQAIKVRLGGQIVTNIPCTHKKGRHTTNMHTAIGNIELSRKSYYEVGLQKHVGPTITQANFIHSSFSFFTNTGLMRAIPIS